MQKLLWHYTVGQHLPKIISSGVVRQTAAFIEGGERPAAWFSSNEEWEQTANKMWLNQDGRLIGLDKANTHKLCGGL